MHLPKDFYRKEMTLARRMWPAASLMRMKELRLLIQRHGFSIELGEIIDLENHWYVTHSGLLHLAFRSRCSGILTHLEERLSDPVAGRWIFKAVVYKARRSRGFVGFGDADPSNVSQIVRGAEMRIAETRAVNRALRKAYGIGLCSAEELSSPGTFRSSAGPNTVKEAHSNGNGSSNYQPRLRDQLSILIRQHNLNPILVKAYAADFCGVKTLSAASRDLVESFISHLTVSAKDQPEALICRLNSYAQPEQAQP